MRGEKRGLTAEVAEHREKKRRTTGERRGRETEMRGERHSSW